MIYVGTSGWNYPSGRATWNGVFYPKPRPKGFDELSFYAQFFNFVEVNATFYGQPRPDVTAAWAERTPKGFQFAVKLFQQFTHPTMFRQRVSETIRKQLAAPEVPDSALDALVEANAADLDSFRQGIEPLKAAGKLGPLLAQFPTSFHDTPANRAHLATLLRAFGHYAVTVELRHRSWSDHGDLTRALLDGFRATWTWIDEPKFKDSVQQPEIETGAFAYLRLHGRNAKAWWHHAHKDDRYDYLYSEEELTPIAEQVAPTKHAYIAFNNHANARAVSNALTFKKLIGEPIPAAVPEPVLAIARP